MKAKALITVYREGKRNFRRADLRGVDLRGADLRGINLSGAILRRADLGEASLRGADLREANMQGANLSWADLRGANLAGARLDGTCLDPMRMGNPDTSGYERHFTRSGQVWCRGYRTRRQPIMQGPDYVDGQWYEAPFFSVAKTFCHPGLHVCSTVAEAKYWGENIISVWFREIDLHHTTDKDRVRAFFVEGEEE